MCLAIPGRVLEITDPTARLARVEVAGVRRIVNLGMLEEAGTGDWVLIHVGFAIARIDEAEARATLRLLAALGDDFAEEIEEIRGSLVAEPPPVPETSDTAGTTDTATVAAAAEPCTGSTHCVTCADEALPLTVLAAPGTDGLVRCAAADGREEQVAVDLVAPVAPGDVLLVHARVALARLEPGSGEGAA